MTESEIRKLLERQRTFFSTGKTLPVSFRLRQLEKLKRSIQKNEPLLRHALKKDLGKSNMESYMCEIGLTLSELSWMQRHVRSLAKNRTVPTPLSQFAAHSYRSPIPYGTVLIMSPWNYPLLLTLEPLIDAIAAGNTVILKPSAYAPFNFSSTVLGCPSFNLASPNSIPTFFSSAILRLSAILPSSGLIPRSPATSALSVPCPFPVARKDP